MMTTSLILPLLLMTGLGPLQEKQATPAERTAEDVEVLRRLLVNEISDRPTDAEPTVFTSTQGLTFAPFAGLPYSGTATRSVPHSRSFHLPGQGVYFSFDVQLPVVEAKPVAKEDPAVERTEADEEWAQIRLEVRTGFRSRRSRFRADTLFGVGKTDDRIWEIDPEAITEVEDAVLRILARHAGRVEGLGNNDQITVAMHLTGADSSPWVIQTEGDGECTSIGWLSGALAARRAPARKLIMQVSLADLRRGDLNGGSELKPSALIHSY